MADEKLLFALSQGRPEDLQSFVVLGLLVANASSPDLVGQDSGKRIHSPTSLDWPYFSGRFVDLPPSFELVSQADAELGCPASATRPRLGRYSGGLLSTEEVTGG